MELIKVTYISNATKGVIMKLKRLQKNKGSALIWSILLMMVFSLFALAIAFLIQFNNNHSMRSVNLIRARQIAEAGIELGYATLTSQSESNSYQMVIKELTAAQLPKSHSTDIIVDSKPIGHFDATISIDLTDPGITWIVVTSQGNVKNSNLIVERVLKINKDNIKDIQRYEKIHE